MEICIQFYTKNKLCPLITVKNDSTASVRAHSPIFTIKNQLNRKCILVDHFGSWKRIFLKHWH